MVVVDRKPINLNRMRKRNRELTIGSDLLWIDENQRRIVRGNNIIT